MLARTRLFNRGITAYIAFSNEKRKELMTKGASLMEASKQSGSEWKSLSDSAKAEWTNRAHELNKIRDEKIARGEIVVAPRKTRSERKAEGPRKFSSYIMFVKEKRPEVIAANPGIIQKDILVKVAELWRSTTPETKKIYVEKAAMHNSSA